MCPAETESEGRGFRLWLDDRELLMCRTRLRGTNWICSLFTVWPAKPFHCILNRGILYPNG